MKDVAFWLLVALICFIYFHVLVWVFTMGFRYVTPIKNPKRAAYLTVSVLWVVAFGLMTLLQRLLT